SRRPSRPRSCCRAVGGSRGESVWHSCSWGSSSPSGLTWPRCSGPAATRCEGDGPAALAVGAKGKEIGMSDARWRISGEYFEACSCGFVCPCPTSGLAAPPTKGHCDAGLVFHIDRGEHGGTKLDGLNFAILLRTPGPMIAGNWTVGVIVDERASAAQREALTAIASGQGGGPVA